MKNANTSNNSNNSKQQQQQPTSNLWIIDNNNNKPSNVIASSPQKLLIHSNDIKLLSDTALLSSIDIFGASNKCEHNTNINNSGVNSNEKSVLVNSKSLVSLASETTNIETTSQQNHNYNYQGNQSGMVKSTSIGKIKPLAADALKISELKQMAGTTQAIEANFDLAGTSQAAATTSTSTTTTTTSSGAKTTTSGVDKDLNEMTTKTSMIRDISMPNIDDTIPPSPPSSPPSTPLFQKSPPPHSLQLNLSPYFGLSSSDALKCSSKSLVSVDNNDDEIKYDFDMCKSAMDMSNENNEDSVDSSINKLNASNKDSKKKVKRSALAWVGRTVGK